MATSRQLPFFPSRWLFWFVTFLLATNTALFTFFVLKDDPVLPFVWYGLGLVLPSSLIGFGTVLFLSVRTHQLRKSFYLGVGIVSASQFIAIFANTLLVNALWQAQRPPCQVQCGNEAIIGAIEIFWPLLSMLVGLALASLACLLGWMVLRQHRNQER